MAILHAVGIVQRGEVDDGVFGGDGGGGGGRREVYSAVYVRTRRRDGF